MPLKQLWGEDVGSLPDLQDKVGTHQRLWTSLPAPPSGSRPCPWAPCPVSTYPSQLSFRDPQPCSPRPPSYPRHGAPHPHPASPLHRLSTPSWPGPHPCLSCWDNSPASRHLSPEPTSAPRSSHPWRLGPQPLGPAQQGAVSRPGISHELLSLCTGPGPRCQARGRSDQHPTALKRVPGAQS